MNPSGSGTFNFNSLTQALHDIKLGIIPTGGITINIAPSYSETIISPMIIDITGTSTKPITIQKDTTLNGVNPRFTRVDSGSINPTVMGGYGDSVIRIDGSDYLTISGIDVFALDSGIEYGYLTHKPSATNGSQYLNIRNCEVSMNKGNSPYVIGIYIGNGTTDPASQIGYAVTSASGKNRFVDISQAMVHNVHTGIRIQGSAASGFYDSDISLGLTAGTNEISDFGGVSDSPSYGVAFFNVSNSTVNNTIIHNYASPAKGNLYGIYFNKLAGALDGAVRANNNNIWLANTSAKGWTYWIDNNMDCNSETITNNIFTAGEISSNGSAYLIDAANHTANKTITGNATQGTITLTGDSAGFSCYNNSQGDSQGFTWVVTEIVSNNNFSNIIATGNSQICGISATDSSPGTKTISNNTLSNWSTQGNVAGIDACNIESVQINNNSISNITASRVWWGIVYRGSNGSSGNVYNNLLTNITMTGPGLLTGIEQGSTFETSNCYNNKLSSMSATHPEATVVGFNMSANSTLTSIYNNMIYGLSAVGGNTASDTPTVTGIKYGGSGVGNIFYNTVYLFASSTAAGFSSAALYHDITSDEAVTGTYSRIRNNIFVNKSVPGSLGRSVAFWKATSGSTAMGASSDRNIYYAGEPDANNLIAYLGTTACSTMNQYKAAVSTVDQASFTEDVPFVSPNGTIDVHINPNIPTYVQNQGTAISGFTTDIDGQTRHSTTPDIGADEGNFTIAPTCVAPIAQPTNLILVPNHNSISVSFTPSLAEEYLVLRHTASAPSAAPVNGTFYWPGQTLGNATIVSSNEATACLATGLSSSTQYYISVYAYNSYGLSAPKYRTTSPLRLAVTTLSASHNQPSAFTATAINATSIALSASPNAAGDNIIVAYSYSPNFGTPLGNYSVGSAITGGGTILYMGSAAGLNSHTGLYPWTRFYYKAWSYYSINRAIYYSYSDGVIANAKTSADPFVGIRTINPNILGANNFISISEALAALNYAGVNFGGVTFNIVAGYVDTLSAPLVFSASGNESSPIVFQKDPATTGANPLIVRNDEGLLATTVLGGNGDSIIRIEGSDFLTLDGIDVQSQNSAIEYGYFATKPSETNGSQHLSIKNCNINMIKAYSKVVGIYISNGPTSVDNSSGVNVTAPSGQNSNVTITGATIRNTSYGILLIGSSATGYPDTDYTIGAEGAGNIIEDYLGYLGSGINVKYVNNPSICYNSLNNAAGGGTDSPCQISGIILADVSGEISVNYNYVNLLVRDSFNAHASMAWISNTGTGSRESYIGNTFGAGYNFSIGLECYFIYLWNNTPIRIVSDNSTPDVGVHISLGRPYGYYSYSDAISGTETVTNNSFTNFKGSWVWGIHIRSNRGGGTICSGNTISGLSGQSVVGIYLDTESTVPSVISNNTISNLTGTYNGVKGIEVSTGVTEIHGNVIDNFAGTASIFYGISQDWGSSICSNNVVTNLNGQYSNTVVRGIRIMCNAEIHNNIIHSLSALGGTYNFSYPDLAAIETGNTPAKLYYNSVLLNSSGTGNTFSSAGLFLGASSHDLRNNSIVNKCTPGNNGRTVAVWRSTGQPMVATSNNNIYYAGVISTSAPYLNMIGYMSGEVKSTLASYQASVFPAEQNSYTEDVPYLSSTEPVDLHINPGIATYIESRAMPIAGYETDSDGQTRNSITPDIGAYEGDYTPNLPPLPASSPSPADLATAQLTDISLSWSRSPGGAAPTSYNVYFGTTNPPTLIGNQAATTYNPGVLAINQTYYWKIDPANSYGVASTTNTVPVWSFTTHNPLPEAAVLVSPSNQATGIAINPSFSWSAGTGFAPLGYKLYLGTDNPPTNVMNGTDLGNVTSYAYPGGRQGNAIRSNNPTDKANPNLFKTELDAMLSRNALNYNTTYHWKVVPYTIAGSALNNAVWSFATELAPVPLAAVNPLPSDLATAVILNPELSWSPNPEGTLPDSYKVYFGTTNPPQLIGSQAGATYTPANLTYSTTYYWKIDPHSERGYASQNNTLPVWSFTTENSLYPTQVVLVSPANGSTGSNTGVSLNWSAGAGATPSGYRISLGTNNPPTNILNGLDLGNVTTCNPAGLLANTTYYWQVVAYNSLGDSAPATVWSFTVPTQEVSIGNGTGTNRSPFGTSYGYERDATLYLASEIGSISQPIRSLAWYATRAVSTATPVKIYLKATTATALPSVNWTSTISGASLVYNSSISSIAANAWMNINLSSAFTLPSGSNLMVLIETNYGGSGNGNFNGGGFRNTSLSPVNTRHKYWMGNTTPPTSTGSFDILRANIRLSSFSSTMALPNPAVVSAPLSGANGVALNSSLNWNSGGGTVTGFKLYLGTDGNGSSTPTNMVYGQDLGYCFSYTPAVSLAYNTTYYWQVILYNSDGIASGSSIWSFTTMQEPSLSLSAPTNLAISIQEDTVELSWDEVPEATSYAIYAADSPNPDDWGDEIAVVNITHYYTAVTNRCFFRVDRKS
ncbi:MAG: fibronectin type III domain-containing protein, partial [Candidatus Cloacimonas sp.]|nr:fibronectin type III domain-containing protein [Candidatus Cloacimonas sp.]